MEMNSSPTPQKTDLPPLARLAGAFLLASAFFAVAAIIWLMVAKPDIPL